MKTMMKVGSCPSGKSTAIVLFLVVLALFLVLQNFQTLEMNSSIPVPRVSTVPEMHRSFCTLQPLSPKDAAEENLLLDSITWPEAPYQSAPLAVDRTSHPAHSTFTILPRGGGGQWHVGDQLGVLIKMSDFQGCPKKFGGDLLFAKLHNQKLGAGVTGQVVDHLNGSYSAVFSLLWEGDAQVQVMLVHPSEAIPVLIRMNSEQPDRMDFKSVFRSGSVSETTTCNICLRPTQRPVCNYTDLRTGEPWFCYKPKKLRCGARISHAKAGFKRKLKANEIKLFQRGVNMKVYIHASGPASVPVLPKKEDLKDFDLHSRKANGPLLALDYAKNILVTFRCHGPPLRFKTLPTSQLCYVANELDGVLGGPNTVIVIGVWSHFGSFPMEFYIRRLQNIRRAVLRLLDRAPGTLVIIRTANPRALGVYEALTNSDWYSLQLDRILRAMFKGLNVHLIDAWEMVLAYHLPHEIHPKPPIIKNMINRLLSYVCPDKGS